MPRSKLIAWVVMVIRVIRVIVTSLASSAQPLVPRRLKHHSDILPTISVKRVNGVRSVVSEGLEITLIRLEILSVYIVFSTQIRPLGAPWRLV